MKKFKVGDEVLVKDNCALTMYIGAIGFIRSIRNLYYYVEIALDNHPMLENELELVSDSKTVVNNEASPLNLNDNCKHIPGSTPIMNMIICKICGSDLGQYGRKIV